MNLYYKTRDVWYVKKVLVNVHIYRCVCVCVCGSSSRGVIQPQKMHYLKAVAMYLASAFEQIQDTKTTTMTHIIDFTEADFVESYRMPSFNRGTYSCQEDIETRWNLLSEFVKEVCIGRDDSHGHAHMKAVAEMTRYLIQEDHIDESGNFMLDAITVAWLHDVADHKYDKDGSLEQRMDDFGRANNIWNYEEVKRVIKYISYSSENKAILAGTPLDFTAILGAYYSQIRHIVSDADKLEAIGKIGISRALEYTREANPSYSEAQVIADVHKHAHEKLLRLASEFIRTPLARVLAHEKHNEMIEELRVL
jgi:HD superfamily phosphodiesterase